MKTLVMTLALLVGTSAAAGQAEYWFVGTWTGDNGFSGAPSPFCAFDLDPNTANGGEIMFVKFENGTQPPNFCYDEYIPAGSRGWAHANVYRRSL